MAEDQISASAPLTPPYVQELRSGTLHSRAHSQIKCYFSRKLSSTTLKQPMNKCLAIILLLLLCYCKSGQLGPGKSSSTGTSSLNVVNSLINPNPKPKTITLFAESHPNDNVSSYYEDEFMDLHNIRFKRDTVSRQYLPVTINSKHGLWLRFTKGMAQYPVYVQPGDSIHIKSTARGKVNYVFSGNNPGELNFYTLLDQQAFGLGFTDIMGVEINHFKFRQRTKMLNYLYKERIRFLNQVKDSLAFTQGFYNYISNHITSVYLSALLTPFYAPKFKLPLPQTYIDTLTAFQNTGFLKQDSLVFSSEHYRRTIAFYNRFLSRQSLKTPQENKELYRNAKASFSGQVRNFALFSFLKERIKQDLDMEPYLKQFRNDCTYKPYIRYLDSLAARPSKLTSDKLLLTNPLITDKDEATSWENILKQNKGKVIYVDMWATWCGPCLMEMPASVGLQEKLKKRILYLLPSRLIRQKIKTNGKRLWYSIL